MCNQPNFLEIANSYRKAADLAQESSWKQKLCLVLSAGAEVLSVLEPREDRREQGLRRLGEFAAWLASVENFRPGNSFYFNGCVAGEDELLRLASGELDPFYGTQFRPGTAAHATAERRAAEYKERVERERQEEAERIAEYRRSEAEKELADQDFERLHRALCPPDCDPNVITRSLVPQHIINISGVQIVKGVQTVARERLYVIEYRSLTAVIKSITKAATELATSAGFPADDGRTVEVTTAGWFETDDAGADCAARINVRIGRANIVLGLVAIG